MNTNHTTYPNPKDHLFSGSTGHDVTKFRVPQTMIPGDTYEIYCTVACKMPSNNNDTSLSEV